MEHGAPLMELSNRTTRAHGIASCFGNFDRRIANHENSDRALFQTHGSQAGAVTRQWVIPVQFRMDCAGAAILATFLVSLTVAPVPSAGVVTMMPALETVGVPVAGLSFLLGIDRIPDMMRSAVNVLSQITTAVLVSRWTDDKQTRSHPD